MRWRSTISTPAPITSTCMIAMTRRSRAHRRRTASARRPADSFARAWAAGSTSVGRTTGIRSRRCSCRDGRCPSTRRGWSTTARSHRMRRLARKDRPPICGCPSSRSMRTQCTCPSTSNGFGPATATGSRCILATRCYSRSPAPLLPARRSSAPVPSRSGNSPGRPIGSCSR